MESETAYIMEETQKGIPLWKNSDQPAAIVDLNSSEEEETLYLEAWYSLDNGFIGKKDVEIKN